MCSHVELGLVVSLQVRPPGDFCVARGEKQKPEPIGCLQGEMSRGKYRTGGCCLGTRHFTKSRQQLEVVIGQKNKQVDFIISDSSHTPIISRDRAS